MTYHTLYDGDGKPIGFQPERDDRDEYQVPPDSEFDLDREYDDDYYFDTVYDADRM